MKKMMKKLGMLVAFTLCVLAVHANPFVDTVTTIRDEWIRPAYPVVAGVVFLVGVFMNLGKFFGENRDIKQGAVNIIVFMGAVLVIVGVFEAITAVTI